MHRGMSVSPERAISIQTMIKEKPCFYLVIYLYHLDEGISLPPFFEMFFLHRFVYDFIANLAFGRITIALDGVHDYLFLREHLTTVRALDVRFLDWFWLSFNRHFLGRVFEII